MGQVAAGREKGSLSERGSGLSESERSQKHGTR